MDDLHPLVVGQTKEGDKCLSVACIQRWKNYTQVGEVEGGFPAGSGITPSCNLGPCRVLSSLAEAWGPQVFCGALWKGLSSLLILRAELLRAASVGQLFWGAATRTGSCWHIPHSFLGPSGSTAPGEPSRWLRAAPSPEKEWSHCLQTSERERQPW